MLLDYLIIFFSLHCLLYLFFSLGTLFQTRENRNQGDYIFLITLYYRLHEDDYNSSEEYLPPGNESESEYSDGNSVENGVDLENSEWNFDINTEPEFVDFTGIPGLRCNVPNSEPFSYFNLFFAMNYLKILLRG